jgi:hypothetical protein
MVQQGTYFGTRNAQKTYGHQHTRYRNLIVTEFDSVQILHTQAPSCYQAIESENFIHLDGRNESATSLSDDMGNYDMVLVRRNKIARPYTPAET